MTLDAPLRPSTSGSTLEATLLPGRAGPGGYRRLERGPGERLGLRRDLGGVLPSDRCRSLVSFVQLSDLHVTDAQSPARAEFLDRHGDADSAHAPLVGRVGTYRAHEALTHQVVEAMAHAVRRVRGGPATGAEPAFAIATGDSTDNCQANELAAYLALLDGGRVVVPDSGDRSRFEGVGSPDAYDPRYWHPDGTPEGAPDDRARAVHGYPSVPGLLDACREPFRAGGLGLPWYAVYGNHDALFGGTLPPGPELTHLVLGSRKPVGLAPGADVLSLLLGNETSPSAGSWGLLLGPTRPVTADRARRPVGAREWIGAHRAAPGTPFGHGFGPLGSDDARAYYAFDAGVVRFLVLDTVNPAGGWQGSLDLEQLGWLEEELLGGHRHSYDASGRSVVRDVEDRLFVLCSHHPLETLVNDHAPGGRRRVLAGELAALLGRFPNVVCWVNGHTHRNAVRAFAPPEGRRGGFWQVTTASHVDWPQQSRLVEIACDEATGELVVATAMLDHAGALDPRRADLDDPLALAGWSRELSANAWQGRSAVGELWGRGRRADRNVALVVPAPFPLARVLSASR